LRHVQRCANLFFKNYCSRVCERARGDRIRTSIKADSVSKPTGPV